MTLRHGLFVSGASAGVTAPQDARLAMAALLSGPGVLNGGVVTGSTSGPNMKYTIAAGTFVTQRGTLATDGLYVVPNDGPVTQDSGSPAPSSGTRWDLVYVRQPNAFGSDGFGDANSDPVFGVQVGTSGSSPTKPYASVPAGALVLAESLVGTSIANASLATISNVAANTQAGTAPIWQSWTPSTIAHFVPGNGTLTCRYILQGKSLQISGFFQAGSTTTYDAGGAMTFTLPAGLTGAARQQTGHVELATGGSTLLGVMRLASGANAVILLTPTSTSSGALIAMNSASPNPGTTGDFVFTAEFEVA